MADTQEESEPKKEDEVPPLIATEEIGDLLVILKLLLCFLSLAI